MTLATDDNAVSPVSQIRTQVVLVVLGGIFGIGSGALMAYLAPIDKFTWAGLAITPLWLFLEICFESITNIASSPRVRISAIVSVLAGFYGAWIWLRM